MSSALLTQQEEVNQCRQNIAKRSRVGSEEVYDGDNQQRKARKSYTFQQAPTLLGSVNADKQFPGDLQNGPKKKQSISIFRAVIPSKPFVLPCPQKESIKTYSSQLDSEPAAQPKQGTLKSDPKKSSQLSNKNQFTLTSLRWRVQNMFHQDSQEKSSKYPSNSKAGYFETSQPFVGQTKIEEDFIVNDCQTDEKVSHDTCTDKNCIHCASTTTSLAETNLSPRINHLRRRRTSILKDLDEDETIKSSFDVNEYFIIPLAYSQTLLTKETTLVTLISMQKIISTESLIADLDYLGYGHFWYIHHRDREHAFQPWQLTLSGKMEKLRLSVTAMYWESMRYHAISVSTIYIAINNFNRLLNSWSLLELEHPTPSQWALTAVIAYRLAFKLEERPEILWEVNSFWDIFPMFSEWSIDRSASNMNKVEMAALDILNDTMDIPLAPMFLNLYLSVGGWPEEVAKEYRDLAMYILGVVTFASIKDHLLRSVVPSIVALAALVLAIKIVNGDRNSPSGILPHLKNCPKFDKSESWKNNLDQECLCRYEVYPDRLKTYCDMQLQDILPVIRGLSNLLRSKPDETSALKYSFPLWGEHDWR